jgi:hypothetical protein
VTATKLLYSSVDLSEKFVVKRLFCGQDYTHSMTDFLKEGSEGVGLRGRVAADEFV